MLRKINNCQKERILLRLAGVKKRPTHLTLGLNDMHRKSSYNLWLKMFLNVLYHVN